MTLAQAPVEFLKVMSNKFQGRKSAPRWSVLWVKVIFPGACNNLWVWVKQEKSGSYRRVCFEFWSQNWNLKNLMQAQEHRDCRFYCCNFLKSWTCPNEKISSLAMEKGTEKIWNMEAGQLPGLRKYIQFLKHSERKKIVLRCSAGLFEMSCVQKSERATKHILDL